MSKSATINARVKMRNTPTPVAAKSGFSRSMKVIIGAGAAVLFLGGLDLPTAGTRLLKGVDEGNPLLTVGNPLELGKQAVADGFGRNGGTVRNEENCAHVGVCDATKSLK